MISSKFYLKNGAVPEQEITQDEIEAVLKFREILKKGHSAEIKRKTDGSLTVYEVRKEKR